MVLGVRRSWLVDYISAPEGSRVERGPAPPTLVLPADPRGRPGPRLGTSDAVLAARAGWYGLEWLGPTPPAG